MVMKDKRYYFFLRFFLFAVLSCILFISCDPVNEDPPYRPVKDKTVLLYFAANNNLSLDAFRNIAEMEKGFVPSENEGNLVIYSHTLNSNPKLIKMYKGQDGKVIKDTVYNFPETNSATPDAVTGAIKVTATMFPAKENGLILWSHATGWLPSGYYSSGTFGKTASLRSFGDTGDSRRLSPWPAYPDGKDPFAGMVKSFGADNSGNTEIEITELVKALPQKFNFIIFDACLMGGIETAYQIKDSTDYVVFSPTEVLTSGYCYNKMMEYLFKSPADLKGMAESVYNYYNSMSNEFYRSVTISVVKSSELPAVAQAAKKVFEKYRQNIKPLNVTGVQRYFRSNKHWFYDISDFISQIAGSAGAEEAAGFKLALDKAVIYKAATNKFLDIIIDKSKYSGVSTYIPNPYNEDLVKFYRNFEWEKEVGMTSPDKQ